MFLYSFLSHPNLNSISSSISYLKSSSLILYLHSTPFFPSPLFLMLRNNEKKNKCISHYFLLPWSHMALHKINNKNSALFTNAISLKKIKLLLKLLNNSNSILIVVRGLFRAQTSVCDGVFLRIHLMAHYFLNELSITAVSLVYI